VVRKTCILPEEYVGFVTGDNSWESTPMMKISLWLLLLCIPAKLNRHSGQRMYRSSYHLWGLKNSRWRFLKSRRRKCLTSRFRHLGRVKIQKKLNR